jgi:DNA-binding CsgD family transcriptional regulator
MQTSSAMPDRDFVRLDFYNEVLRPMRVHHGLVLTPLCTRHSRVHVIADRRLGREDFNSGDVDALQWLAPHIATALHVSRRLAAVDLIAAGACAALDQLDTAVVLIDAMAKVVFANRTAESLLVEAQVLTTEGGCIVARDRRSNMALLRELGCCLANGQSSRCRRHVISLPRGDGRMDLRVIVAPFRPDDIGIDTPAFSGQRPLAMIMISDPERERSARKERLRREFGLTEAEADVTLEIIKGDGRDATAARLGIGVATVRTHLVRIFEKTGVGRQAELVRLILRGETDADGG